jgi:hypothetical protein
MSRSVKLVIIRQLISGRLLHCIPGSPWLSRVVSNQQNAMTFHTLDEAIKWQILLHQDPHFHRPFSTLQQLQKMKAQTKA